MVFALHTGNKVRAVKPRFFTFISVNIYTFTNEKMPKKQDPVSFSWADEEIQRLTSWLTAYINDLTNGLQYLGL